MLNVLPIIFCVFVFNLVTVNKQGLWNLSRRQTVFNLIKKQKYDVIFLQEMHWTDDLKDTILSEWGGTILFNNFEHNARGTAILFSTTFDFRICDHTSNGHRTLDLFSSLFCFFILYRRKYLGRRFQLYLWRKIRQIRGKLIYTTDGNKNFIYDYATTQPYRHLAWQKPWHTKIHMVR